MSPKKSVFISFRQSCLHYPRRFFHSCKNKLKEWLIRGKGNGRYGIGLVKQEIRLLPGLWRSAATKPGVLLSSVRFLKAGGLEKRLFQQAQVWKARGYNVYYGAGKSDEKVDLLFTGNRLYDQWLFKRFSRLYSIRVFEWNAGGSRGPWVSLSVLRKQKIKTGIVIHASHDTWDYKYLHQADYVLCASAAHGKRVRVLQKYPVVSNAVSKQPLCWKFNHQREALMISRLGKDKIPSISSFIDLCSHWKIPFYIAGDFSERLGDTAKRILQEKYNLADSVFSGRIDTTEFLQSQWSKFLFVGGLGQVILEAGQLNYPCLLCNLCGAEESFFVSKSNLKQVLDYNCSPHSMEESILLKSGQDVTACFGQICQGITAPWECGELINRYCGLEKQQREYSLYTR